MIMKYILIIILISSSYIFFYNKDHDISLVPFFLENVVLVKSLNIDDGLHPNRDGYEKIVQENVLPVVKEVLK